MAYSLSYPLYNTCGCVFSVYPFPCDDLENIYALSYYHHQRKSEVWTITHCLGLGHETMVCAVCLFVFLFLRLTLCCVLQCLGSVWPWPYSSVWRMIAPALIKQLWWMQAANTYGFTNDYNTTRTPPPPPKKKKKVRKKSVHMNMCSAVLWLLTVR